MTKFKYNFMICQVVNGKAVVTRNFNMTHDKFTIAPHGNDEVITLLEHNLRFILNKKIVDGDNVYCVVCEPIRNDRLLAKCKKILCVSDLPPVIASYCISNTVSLNIYEIVNGINTQVRAGLNDNTPRLYKVYHDEKCGAKYFNFRKRKMYLNEFI